MTTERLHRQKRLLETLRDRGRARVSELCDRLEASEATIRRDLDDLEASGLLKRIHGGAVAVEANDLERAVLRRFKQQEYEKRAIARAAAQRVVDGDTIFLSSGSTTLHMVPHLKAKHGITVVTNSLPVVNGLVNFPECKAVVVGGLVRGSELSLIGHVAVRTLEELRADKVFMGAEAIHPDHGITNSDLDDTMTDRAIVKISPQIIVLADHGKFNRVHASFWGPLEMVQLIITDWETDEAVIRRLSAAGVPVEVVRPEE